MRFGHTPTPRAIVWLSILLDGTPWTHKDVYSIEEVDEIVFIEVGDGEIRDFVTVRKPDGLEQIEDGCNRSVPSFPGHVYDYEHVQVEVAWDYIEALKELAKAT